MNIRVKKILFSVILAILLVRFAHASLATRIDSIIDRPLQQGVRFSINIIESDTGRTAYRHDAKEIMIPASNMKIITTAAALRYLGADFEYITKVGIRDNTVIVIGSGDPLLGDEKTDMRYGREKDWIFKNIKQILQSEGISAIEDIIIDTGVFDNELVHPSWPRDQLNRWYACEVCGLNYNDNCIQMSTKNINGKVSIFIEPQTSFVTLVNNVKPITMGDSAVGAYRNQQSNQLIVRGKCKDEVGPFDVAIEKPAAFFGFLLAEHLNKSGISVAGQLIEKVLDENSDFNLLAEYKTPLSDCLKRSNKDSLGLVAEALFKTIAAANNPGGKKGSWDRGRELISKYLEELDIGKDQFYIDDGSGLSKENKLSAHIITKVLLDVYHSDNWDLYRDSLAVGGEDGTSSIANNFKEEKYKGKILGKSGYINGVKSLSGICITAGGDYIFSILTNNTNGQTRTTINNIIKTIIDEAEDKEQ